MFLDKLTQKQKKLIKTFWNYLTKTKEASFIKKNNNKYLQNNYYKNYLKQLSILIAQKVLLFDEITPLMYDDMGIQIPIQILNNITNHTNDNEYFSITTRVLMSLLFVVLSIIGIVGNLLIITVVYHVPGMVNFFLIIIFY